MTVRIWGLSKRRAHYRPATTPDGRCDRCKYMFPPLALVGAGWFGDRSEAPPPVMSSLPAERSETEPSLGATESPGRSSLPTNRLPQGSGPRGHSKTQSSLNAAMIASRSWRLKASVTPGRTRPTLAIDLLCRSTRAESQSSSVPVRGVRVG